MFPTTLHEDYMNTVLHATAPRPWDLHTTVGENVPRHHLCGADTAPVIKMEQVRDTWRKTGRCQLYSLAQPSAGGRAR